MKFFSLSFYDSDLFRFLSFTSEFLKWTIPCLNLDVSIVAYRDGSQKSKTEWLVLDLHCLHRYHLVLVCSAERVIVQRYILVI